VLAIAGGKGGIGRTTTTLGLAAGAAALTDQRVLAVDADRHLPDLHAVAGVDARPGAAAVADGRSPGQVAAATSLDGVGVVPAPPDIGERTLRAALERVRSRDGPVLVDCPAGGGPDAALPVRLADRTLVVSTPTPASRRDAATTVRMARALGTEVVGILLTRCDDDPSRDDICGRRVVGTVPEVDTTSPLSVRDVRTAYRRAATVACRQNA